MLPPAFLFLKTSGDGQLTWLVEWSRRLKTSQPEDKVFALYWAFKAVDNNFPSPDYSKSIAEIYREATVALLQSERSLNLLNSAFDYEDSLKRPSWVPNYNTCLEPVFLEGN